MSLRNSALSSREWLWLGLLGFLVALAADAPRIVATLDPPPGLDAVYPTVMAAEDYPQYLAAMREAIETGSWRSSDPFSTEPHEPVVLRPFYTLLGQIARLGGTTPETIYLLAAFGGRWLLWVAIYLFAALFFEGAGVRSLAVAVTLLVSGLLGLLDVFSGVLPEGFVATFEQRSERPEYNSFLLLFHHPHLTCATAFLLLIARVAVRSVGTRGRRAALHAGCLALLIFLLAGTNPFSVIPVGAALGCWLLWLAFRERESYRLRAVLFGVPAGLIAAGVFILGPAFFVFRNDPFWKATYGTPRGQETPAPELMLFHLFFVLVFAAFGLRSFFSRRTAATRLAAAWIVATVPLMVVPIDFQLRFAFGLQPVLAVLATSGVVALWRRARDSASFAALLALLAIGALATPLAFSRAMALSATGEMLSHLRFRTAEEVEAAAWLRDHAKDDAAVLGTYPTGNYLGGQIRGRVYVGHNSGTLDLPDKRTAVQRFFKGSEPLETKRAFLRGRGIDYVFFGPFERYGASAETRAVLAELTPVFRRPGVVVYGVD